MWSEELADSAGADPRVRFWGGMFWVFYEEWGQATSTYKVARYDQVAKKLDVVQEDSGHYVRAAGVSVCAPIAPPK